MAVSPRTGFVLHLIFILYSAICILPFLLVLGISLSSEKSLVDFGYHIFPKIISANAYIFIANEASSLLKSYGVTIYATLLGTALSVMITTLFAYPLSRKDFKYRNIFSFIIFFTMIFHGGMIATYMIYVETLHVRDNLIVYLLPFLINAWNVILMRTFLSNSIPDALIEAARIDGAGELTIFKKIILPLSLPGLATIALFTAIAIWNDWNTPLLYITKPELYNLQYYLYTILNNISYLESNADIVGNAGAIMQDLPTLSVRMAMCIVSIGPIIFAFPYLQKYFVKGLTIGSVKG
jgi:putative aldouronate transport system permease protein